MNLRDFFPKFATKKDSQLKKICLQRKKNCSHSKNVCLHHKTNLQQIATANSRSKFPRQTATANSHGKKPRQIPTTKSCSKFLGRIATANNHYKYMRSSASNVAFNTSFNKKKFHVLCFNLR